MRDKLRSQASISNLPLTARGIESPRINLAPRPTSDEGGGTSQGLGVNGQVRHTFQVSPIHLLIYHLCLIYLHLSSISLSAPGLNSGTRDHHRVRLADRLSSRGVKAWWLCDTWALGSLTRNHTPIPGIARQTLDHWTTREVISLRESLFTGRRCPVGG